MFSIEHEFDCTVITILDEGSRQLTEDISVTNFEEWNGSSWTALTAAPTAVALSMGSGPETASFFASAQPQK